MRRPPRSCVAFAVTCVAFAAAACGQSPHAGAPDASGSGGSSDASLGPDAMPDASVPVRPLLASGGVQVIVTGPDIGLQITPADLATDADVLEIHQEFYGVPWDAFLANTAPPAEWVAAIDQIAQAAHATGKPIFLSVSMLNGGRDSLAAKTAIENGTVQSSDGWAAQCYDFATASDGGANKAAYLRYVAYMLTELSPKYFAEAIEVNLFFEHCPGSIAGVVDVANAAYTAAKAQVPGIVAFPTIQIDHLYGYDAASCPDQSNRDACFDANYAAIAPLLRDRFAMSSYPIPIVGATAADLPTDWFSRAAARGGERPIISETGADSTALVVDTRDDGCQTLFSETETIADGYLARVLADAKSDGMDVINWWSDRDLVVAPLMTACPCSFDATWCAVLDAFRGPPTTSGPDTQAQGEVTLKAFGTMGLRAYDGTEKASLYAAWQAARQ